MTTVRWGIVEDLGGGVLGDCRGGDTAGQWSILHLFYKI